MSLHIRANPTGTGGGGGVTSVNGDVGPAVTLDTDNITEGAANLYYTTARSQGDSLVSSVAGRTGAVTIAHTDVSGLGTSSTIDVGTTANKIVQLDATAKLPAVDGSQLTNLPSAPVTSVNTATGAVVLDTDDITEGSTNLYYTTARSQGDSLVSSVAGRTGAVTIAHTDVSGLGTAAPLDVGTTANKIVQLDATAKLPAVDGSQLTNLPSAPVTSVNTATGAVSIGLDDVVSVSSTTATSISTGGLATSGDITASANLTHTIGSESNRFITMWGDVDGALRFKAKNDSGGLITKGQVVYIKGVSGTVPTVDLARANSASTMPAFGLAYANSNAAADVEVVTFGSLLDLNTSAHTLGDTLYVSSAAAGALVSTAPTGEANLVQNIGRVVRSDASAGIIKVGGAGRSAATPNLDNGKIFIGNVSNQSTSSTLDSDIVPEGSTNLYYTTARSQGDSLVSSVAGRTGAVTLSNTDISGLGTSSTIDVGTTANKIVQLDATAKLPAVDGSQLTNLPSSGGGWTYSAITSASSPVTASTSYHYGSDTSGGAIVFNLPALSGLSGGEQIRVKLNTAGNNLTITPNGSDTVEGAATFVVSVAKSSVTVVADNGTNWEVI